MEVAETGIWEITGPEQVTCCLPYPSSLLLQQAVMPVPGSYKYSIVSSWILLPLPLTLSFT